MEPIPFDIFSSTGNKELTDQVMFLRLAKITAVNTFDMVVDIEFLGDTSGKTRVPIPMPMASPGHGIFAIPTKGAMVVVGIRAMQVPMILAYYPFNAFYPDSFFSQMAQTFGMPEKLSEGDIYMRARLDTAKCEVCGEESPVAAFEANIDPETLVERCPVCNTPTVETDSEGRVVKLNKRQFGTTLHMKASGEIVIQADNLSSSAKGDSERLLKIIINTKTSEIQVENAGDINIGSDKDIRFTCKNFSVNADESIGQTSNTKVSSTTSDVVEEYKSLVVTATDTLAFNANTLSQLVDGLIIQEAKGRTVELSEDEIYSARTLSRTLEGNNIFEIKGNEVVDIAGKEDRTIKGGSTLEVGGDRTETISGTYSLVGAGDGAIKFTEDLKIDAATLILNGGSLEVARKTDPTLINSSTDAGWFTYLADIKTVLDEIKSVFNAHAHPALGSPPASPLIQTAPSTPSAIDGKIDGGNATVLA